MTIGPFTGAAQAAEDFKRNMDALTTSPGESAAGLDQIKQGILRLGAGTSQPPAHACHHCGNPATSQWQRQATPDEAEQHWSATEANIRASNSGNPAVEYTHPRNDTVTKAVFGCGQHPDPCPGRVHDADCQGHGHCRCVRTDATPEQEAALREQHAEAVRAATEGLAAQRADDA